MFAWYRRSGYFHALPVFVRLDLSYSGARSVAALSPFFQRRCCFQESTVTCRPSFCHQKLLTWPIKLPNGIPGRAVDGLPSNLFVMFSLDSQCLLTIPELEHHRFGSRPHHPIYSWTDQ